MSEVGKIHIERIISLVSPVKTNKNGMMMNIKTGINIKNSV